MTTQASRSVVKKVFAVETAEGAGAIARRSIGSGALRNLSPFLLLDHFTSGKGSGFPEHPHRGQCTITYMLEGKYQHEDFKGHKGVLAPGYIQFMNAGRGMVHSEMPIHEEGQPDPSGLQLWTDLPAKNKMDLPDYQEWSADQMPYAQPSKDVRIHVASGEAQGEDGIVKGPTKTKLGCWFSDLVFSAAGAKHFHAVPAGWTTFAYIIDGQIKFDSDTPIDKQHTVVFSSEGNQTGVQMESITDNARLVLIAGEPLDQPVVQHGPFVMTSPQEIRQTMMDYSLGVNGFEGAHEWRSESARSIT